MRFGTLFTVAFAGLALSADSSAPSGRCGWLEHSAGRKVGLDDARSRCKKLHSGLTSVRYHIDDCTCAFFTAQGCRNIPTYAGPNKEADARGIASWICSLK